MISKLFSTTICQPVRVAIFGYWRDRGFTHKLRPGIGVAEVTPSIGIIGVRIWLVHYLPDHGQAVEHYQNSFSLLPEKRMVKHY